MHAQYAEMWSGVPRVPSLFSLALEALAKCLEPHVETLKVLPRSLKTRLLTIACKRGAISTTTLESLLHSDVMTLNLSESDVVDDHLRAMRVCSQLKKLYLNPGHKQEHNLSKEALISLWPSLPLLKVLYLRCCPGVTDDVVAMIGKSCPLLTALDIGGCHAVTDAAPAALAQSLHRLRSLNLSGSQVGDEGLLQLVQGHCGKTLTELHISHCMRVTDFAIQCIAQNCSKMSVLIFQGCPVSTCGKVIYVLNCFLAADSHYALENIYAVSKVKQFSWTVY